MAWLEQELGGWGRYPRHTCKTYRAEKMGALASLLSRQEVSSYLGRGLGRSYGDAALNSRGGVVLHQRLNRFLSFDPDSGRLHCEAGVTLEEILQVCLPQGWFLPVTPGTKFATVAGCIACDVHGKNHHLEGSFSRHVRSLSLLPADGRVVECSDSTNPDLFWATVAGMGLTGLILEVQLQLKKVETAYIDVEYHRTADLNETMERMEAEDDRFLYSVAWLDCLASGTSLGRSVLMRGNHCSRDQLEGASSQAPLEVRHPRLGGLPVDMPSFLINGWTMRALNALYYRRFSRGRTQRVEHYHPYFYPLDAIHDWNRGYGKRGFLQYQCSFPMEQSPEGLRRLLEAVQANGFASFVVVLKRFGEEGSGLLSFPSPGYTITFDFPMCGSRLLQFLDGLDTLVLAHGGRVYLAKDARLSPDSFREMFPRYRDWLAVKREVDPENLFDSDLARRIGLTGARV